MKFYSKQFRSPQDLTDFVNKRIKINLNFKIVSIVLIDDDSYAEPHNTSYRGITDTGNDYQVRGWCNFALFYFEDEEEAVYDKI